MMPGSGALLESVTLWIAGNLLSPQSARIFQAALRMGRRSVQFVLGIGLPALLRMGINGLVASPIASSSGLKYDSSVWNEAQVLVVATRRCVELGPGIRRFRNVGACRGWIWVRQVTRHPESAGINRMFKRMKETPRKGEQRIRPWPRVLQTPSRGAV
jgi:hypothetical protein